MRAVSLCLLVAGLSAQAIDVYLYPSPGVVALDSDSGLALGPAGAALAQHLGLERFEALDKGEVYSGVFNEQVFVGQGVKNGLLLSLSEEDVDEVIPQPMRRSFTISDVPETSSLSSLISTYLHRASASSIYKSIFSAASLPSGQNPPRLLDLFSISSPSTDKFISELSTVSAFFDAESNNVVSNFAAVEFEGLAEIAAAYGRSSEQYILAASATRAILSSAISQPNLHIALLTFTQPQTLEARQGPQPPKQSPLPPTTPSPVPQFPVGSASCFADADACGNATNSCSGRGHCVQTTKLGKSCFACACSAIITDEGKKETWVGDACERKDVSGPFVLLAGTGIGLIILIFASVSLLYSIGNHDLPSVLLAGGAHAKRE